MAKIVGAIASSHTPTIGFAFDTNKPDDPVWAPIFEAYAPMRSGSRTSSPTCCSSSTTTTSRRSSSTTTRPSRSASAARTRSPTKAAARATCRPCRPPGARRHIGRGLVADEFDMSFFQASALDHGCFSPLSMLCAAHAATGRRHRAAAGRRAAVPVPIGAPLLQARPGAAPGDRELSRGHQGGDRRHRRPLAPGPRRARRLQQPRVGRRVHGPPRERSGTPRGDDTRGATPSCGGIEGAEVIMWLVMRGALSAQRPKLHRDLLPAVDDRHRHRDLRER